MVIKMWFKNLRIYKITDAIIQLLDGAEYFEDALKKFEFVPCFSLDPMR